MAGPYSAFTYGDPAAVNQYANNPRISSVIKRLHFGLELGLSYTPVPVAQVLAGGIVGTAYSETVSVQGGTSPDVFSLSSGTLPAGLSLNSSTGVISGTPTTPGTSTFTVQVTDANGFSGTQSFTITISAASAGGGNYGYVG